jgi:hypothetical protein
MPAMEHFGTQQNQKLFSRNLEKMEQVEVLFLPQSTVISLFSLHEKDIL